MNIIDILNEHVDADGKLNVAETEKALKAGIATEYVPKHDFNSKIEQLKDANSTIEKLQKDNKENEALQAEINDLKARADKAEQDLIAHQIRKDAEDALREKGVTNIEFALFKMGELERDADGKLKDFDTKFTKFAEANPDFIKKADAEEGKPAFKLYGAKPAAVNKNADPTKVSLAEALGQQRKAEIEATTPKVWGEY